MIIIGITGGVGSGKTELLKYVKKHYNCRILLSDEASHEVMRPGGIAYHQLIHLLEQYPPDPSMEKESGGQPDLAAAQGSEKRQESGTDQGLDRGSKKHQESGTDQGCEKHHPESLKWQGTVEQPDLHSLLEPDGSISHKEMAARIFAHKDLLERVNAILHPAVREYILEAIAFEKRKSKAGAADAVDYFFLEAALLIEGGYNAVVDQMWYIYSDRATRIRRLREARGYSDEKIKAIMDAQLSEEEFRKGSDVVIDNSGSLADAYRQIDRALVQVVHYGKSKNPPTV